MLALQNYEIKTKRQNKEQSEKLFNQSLKDYCYNYDLNIIDVKVLEYFNPSDKIWKTAAFRSAFYLKAGKGHSCSYFQIILALHPRSI